MSSKTGKSFRSRNPWYELWYGAKRRCEDPEHKSYKYCGAIGIQFLLSQHDCELIFNRDGGHWMTQPSLDRRDATSHYDRFNCRVIEKSINERLPKNAELAAEWMD